MVREEVVWVGDCRMAARRNYVVMEVVMVKKTKRSGGNGIERLRHRRNLMRRSSSWFGLEVPLAECSRKVMYLESRQL